MQGLKYKAVNFDLDTKALKQHYPGKVWRNAYSDIRRFLIKNGFRHRQWSGYISERKMARADVVALVLKLKETFPWIQECVNHFDITDIGKTFDMQGMLTERNDISEDVQPAAAIGEPIKINR